MMLLTTKYKYFDFVIKPGTTNSGSTLILFEQLLPDKHTIVIVIECRYSQPSATKETHRLQTHEIKAKILKTIKKFKPFFKGGTKSKSTELGKLNITKESIYHIFCTFQQVHGDVDIVQFKVKDKAFYCTEILCGKYTLPHLQTLHNIDQLHQDLERHAAIASAHTMPLGVKNKILPSELNLVSVVVQTPKQASLVKSLDLAIGINDATQQ